MLLVCKVVMVTIISSSAWLCSAVGLWHWLCRIYSPSGMFVIYWENREGGTGEKWLKDFDFQGVPKTYFPCKSANVLRISKTVMSTGMYIWKCVRVETAIELNSKSWSYSKETWKLSCIQHFWMTALNYFTGGLYILILLYQCTPFPDKNDKSRYLSLTWSKTGPSPVMTISEWKFFADRVSNVRTSNQRSSQNQRQ